MRIGELARLAEVSTKTIRYYEDIGVLPQPERSANGYRDYRSDSVDRLGFVRDAQATGLTLTEIASILELRDRGESTCGHISQLLESHLRGLDDHIRVLRRTRKKLADLTERARSLDPAECTDPHRCQTIAAGSSRSVPAPATAHLHDAPHPHQHT